MYILDTNVLSELMKPPQLNPSSRVIDWVDACFSTSLYSTAINRAEILDGILRLPSGARRERLYHSFRAIFDQMLGLRVLPFDAGPSDSYAQLSAMAKAKGVTVAMADKLIAAIAHHHGYTIVTRNISDFAYFPIETCNPF